MTYTYNVPLYSQTAYVQEYNVGSGYTMINPYDGYNEYRYRSRMVYECLYRVGEYDGFRYYYRYDPINDTRYYECYSITTGIVYAFNLQTGNWDVIYTPVQVVTTNSYDAEKSTMDDCDRLVFEWNNLKKNSRDFSSEKGIATVRHIFSEMKERFPGYVGDLLETETKIPEPETTSTSYHVDFGYVPEGFDTQSVQEAVQNIQPQPTPLSSSGAPCYTTFDGKYSVPEYVDPQPMPQKINSPEYAEYNKAIDDMTRFINESYDKYGLPYDPERAKSEHLYPIYGLNGELLCGFSHDEVTVYDQNHCQLNNEARITLTNSRRGRDGYYGMVKSKGFWYPTSVSRFYNGKYDEVDNAFIFVSSDDENGRPISLRAVYCSDNMISASEKLGIYIVA